MDISKETNKDKLQALAYQQMKLLEQTQRNLQILEARIAELDNMPAPAPAPAPTEEPPVKNKK